MDCVLRWDVEQEGGVKDLFEALGGQLWGARLSQFSAQSTDPFPVCDTALVVVKIFRTSKAAMKYDRVEEKVATRHLHKLGNSCFMEVPDDLKDGLTKTFVGHIPGSSEFSFFNMRCVYKRFAVKMIVAYGRRGGPTEDNADALIGGAVFATTSVHEVLTSQLRLLDESAPASHSCMACGVPDTIVHDDCELGAASPVTCKVCAGCRLVRFCGTACQKAAWKNHKAVCLAGGLAEDGSSPLRPLQCRLTWQGCSVAAIDRISNPIVLCTWHMLEQCEVYGSTVTMRACQRVCIQLSVTYEWQRTG